MADLDQQLLLLQQARRGPWHDCASLPAVVETPSQQTCLGLVLADAEFESARNHTYIRRHLGARSVIPAKRGEKTWRVRGVRAEMRRAFPQKLYRRRALIETLYSSVKRKLSARVPGRSLRMRIRQALLRGLSFNLYHLRHRYTSLRMSTERAPVYILFWQSPFTVLRHVSKHVSLRGQIRGWLACANLRDHRAEFPPRAHGDVLHQFKNVFDGPS